MKVRVGLYILLILFLLISGKEEARAGRYAAKGDTCRVSDRMNQPETWSKIYQWVMDDPQVPDKEDVLMLIRYHFGNFEKLRKLLRYLDGGRPYAYLLEHQFRKIERTGKMKDSLPVAALTLPANTLPEEQLETIAFAPQNRDRRFCGRVWNFNGCRNFIGLFCCLLERRQLFA